MATKTEKPNGSTQFSKKETPFAYSVGTAWEQILRKDGEYINVFLPGTSAATAGNYNAFFIARYPLEVMRISVAFSAASTSGTLHVERLTGTTANGAGSNITGSTFDLSATVGANTVVYKQGINLTDASVLQEGDRLSLVDGGTLTNLQNLIVTIYFKPAGRGDYR